MELTIDEIRAVIKKEINKHINKTKQDIAEYRDDVRRIEKKLDHLAHKYVNAFGEFQEESDSLPSKLKEIKETLASQAVGVQNVYNAFHEVLHGDLVTNTKKQIDKMKRDLFDAKLDIMRDIDFVKKCYKEIYILQEIKNLKNEDFEKLLDFIRAMNG